MDLWPVGPVMIDEAETFRFGTFGAETRDQGADCVEVCAIDAARWKPVSVVDIEPSVDGVDCVSGCLGRQWMSQFGASVEV